MLRALALLLAAFAALLPAAPVLAQSGARVVASTSWVEEWDPASGRWVRVEDEAPAPGFIAAAATMTTTTTTTLRSGGVTITETVIEAAPQRFAALPHPASGWPAGALRYGPFMVLDGKRAALIGSTDRDSPADFRAMLAAHPGLERLDFLDAPGTRHDLANLRLGRLIRAAGLATHVPEGGSARSGAVELFLAGTRRSMDAGALFAVHSWRDEVGREPADFAPDAPENRLYLDYYTEMGMSEAEARAFYAMTNSVPHAGALWIKGSEMMRWVAPEAAPRPAAQVAARSRSITGPTLSPWLVALPGPGGPLVLTLSAAQRAPQIAHADPGVRPVLLDSGVAFP